MKPQMRRMLAYVIARLVAKTESNSLYDYQEISYFSYNGIITNELIRVQDNSTSSYLQGSVLVKDKKKIIRLHDPVEMTNIEISMEDDPVEKNQVHFKGVGIGQPMQFHGITETNGRVSFYDSSTGMYYRLKL